MPKSIVRVLTDALKTTSLSDTNPIGEYSSHIVVAVDINDGTLTGNLVRVAAAPLEIIGSIDVLIDRLKEIKKTTLRDLEKEEENSVKKDPSKRSFKESIEGRKTFKGQEEIFNDRKRKADESTRSLLNLLTMILKDPELSEEVRVKIQEIKAIVEDAYKDHNPFKLMEAVSKLKQMEAEDPGSMPFGIRVASVNMQDLDQNASNDDNDDDSETDESTDIFKNA